MNLLKRLCFYVHFCGREGGSECTILFDRKDDVEGDRLVAPTTIEFPICGREGENK